MKKNLKHKINAMNKQEIRKILTDSSSSKEDKKIAEDELLRRNSQLRGDENNSPTIDSKKMWMYIIVGIVIFKLIKYLNKQ
jgi:hypothetical protein